MTKNQTKEEFKNILLSICLPVYNQSDKVREFFKNIIPQLNPEISSHIEIVIRDDSTNDETKNVVSRYPHNNLRYFCEKKEGIDQALIFLLEKARGEFVWWFGDDVLEDGIVEILLDIIKSNPAISLIYLNSKNINDDSDIAFRKEGDYFFRDRNQVLEEINDQLGFITAVVFSRRYAMQSLNLAYKHIGTSWVSLFIILSVVANGEKFYFIQKPYILSSPKPPGEKRWYDSFQVHGINYFLIVQEFKDYFDKKVLRKALAEKFGRSWRAVVVERAMGLTTGFGSKSPKVLKMAKLYWSYPEFYIALPLFLTPRLVLKIFYKLYRFLFRCGGK